MLEVGPMIKTVYQILDKNMEENQFINTWCSQVRFLLYKLNLQDLWTQRDRNDKRNYKNLIRMRLNE